MTRRVEANKDKCSAVAEMGDRLATIDMCRKLGAVPLLGGAGSPCNSAAWAEACLLTKWRLDPSSRLATTNMDRKFGGCALKGSWIPI